MPPFESRLTYHDRRSKAAYVHDKYRSILTGRVLDVGADEEHLSAHLSSDVEYVGVGLGGKPTIEIDLEDHPLPFGDQSFDCVLCLDVLEHLDNLHAVFDELCRVSRRYVVLALPNAWAAFFSAILGAAYSQERSMKFYGLPVDAPPDRHKWFFSFEEAAAFVRQRGQANHMRVLHLDGEEQRPPIGRRAQIKSWLMRRLLPDRVTDHDVHCPTLWAVLERAALDP